jgi:hypothetical protein
MPACAVLGVNVLNQQKAGGWQLSNRRSRVTSEALLNVFLTNKLKMGNDISLSCDENETTFILPTVLIVVEEDDAGCRNPASVTLNGSLITRTPRRQASFLTSLIRDVDGKCLQPERLAASAAEFAVLVPTRITPVLDMGLIVHVELVRRFANHGDRETFQPAR